jgi:hypothetical protein
MNDTFRTVTLFLNFTGSDTYSKSCRCSLWNSRSDIRLHDHPQTATSSMDARGDHVLVHRWGEFKSASKSALLFLLGIPAVFQNNMFWHPDSLATLLVVLTIFSPVRDDLHFATWFYVAAACCGPAAGSPRCRNALPRQGFDNE